MLNTVLEQNYTQFSNQYYKQNEGFAIGAPTSAILAEVFIQYIKFTKIIDILKGRRIVDHFLHVDDTILIYSTHTTSIDNTLRHSLHLPNIRPRKSLCCTADQLT
jgi:hypothetical protein